MVIETEFKFDQIQDSKEVRRLKLHDAGTDLLGPLRAFIGHNHTRTWSGKGFNLIWRPNFNGASGSKDHFLELNMTTETLSFTDITGRGGIANRGFLQTDVALGGLAYQQEVSDSFTKKALHFEPGVWANVPILTNPSEKASVVRMGSIPHGTTINAQGSAVTAPKPVFTNSSIIPFALGNVAPPNTGTLDDGLTGLLTADFPESTAPLAQVFDSRTPEAQVPGLTDAHFTNPILILSDIANAQNITSTEVFIITTEVAAPNSSQDANLGVPDAGGGTDNIAFLTGTAGGPNAIARRMSAIFWVETITEPSGKTFRQLQYIQRVLLDFNGIRWPHVSVATLT